MITKHFHKTSSQSIFTKHHHNTSSQDIITDHLHKSLSQTIFTKHQKAHCVEAARSCQMLSRVIAKQHHETVLIQCLNAMVGITRSKVFFFGDVHFTSPFRYPMVSPSRLGRNNFNLLKGLVEEWRFKLMRGIYSRSYNVGPPVMWILLFKPHEYYSCKSKKPWLLELCSPTQLLFGGPRWVIFLMKYHENTVSYGFWRSLGFFIEVKQTLTAINFPICFLESIPNKDEDSYQAGLAESTYRTVKKTINHFHGYGKNNLWLTILTI